MTERDFSGLIAPGQTGIMEQFEGKWIRQDVLDKNIAIDILPVVTLTATPTPSNTPTPSSTQPSPSPTATNTFTPTPTDTSTSEPNRHQHPHSDTHALARGSSRHRHIPHPRLSGAGIWSRLPESCRHNLHDILRADEARLCITDLSPPLQSAFIKPAIHQGEILTAVVDFAVFKADRLPSFRIVRYFSRR